MKNNKTKNIIGFLIMAVTLMIIGCKETPVEKEVVVEKEVIIVAPPEVIEEEVIPEKTTSITIDGKGVELETKKIDVKIKKD